MLGHRSGYDRVKKITPVLPEYGIRYVTYYTLSIENWKRSEEEISNLMELFREAFSSLEDYAMRHGICVKAIGNLGKLSPDIVKKIDHITNLTRSNDRLTAIVAISYGGRDEIIRAVKKVAHGVLVNEIDIGSLDEEMFASYLDTSGIPYPDVVVRTSEKRLSNFLIWQSAYSEIFFVDKLWPDFDEEDLKNIVSEFSQKERRYGK